MMSCLGKDTAKGMPILVFCMLLLPITACNRPSQGPGTMTSYSSNSGQTGNKDQLFIIPQEQLAHLQIVTVASHCYT